MWPAGAPSNAMSAAFDRHTLFRSAPSPGRRGVRRSPVLGSVDPVGGVGIRHEHPVGVESDSGAGLDVGVAGTGVGGHFGPHCVTRRCG